MTTTPVHSITDEQIAEIEASFCSREIYSAYYYSFDSVQCSLVDEILRKVAKAGKSFHDTEDWQKETHTGVSPVYAIQNAASNSAIIIRALITRLREAEKDAAQRFQRRGKRLYKGAGIA